MYQKQKPYPFTERWLQNLVNPGFKLNMPHLNDKVFTATGLRKGGEQSYSKYAPLKFSDAV